MIASAVLEDGAWTLAESRRAIDRAAVLLQQKRDLILIYRPHRFRAIAGSSDLNDAPRRAVLRALASQPTKTFAGLSRGGVCMLCGHTIKPEQIEYEIEAAVVTMTLDLDCYSLFCEQVAETKAASVNDAPRARSRPLDGLTVLVVDDHRDTVDMVEVFLTASGASVLACDRAKEAVALAECHTLDAALVDLRMPFEDGWWFLRQLRASQTASAQAAVFVLSGERHDDPGSASDFAGYFLKPVDLDKLVAALATLPRRLR